MRTMLLLQPASDVDPDELEQLTIELRMCLLDELEITAADPAISKQVPDNAKPADAITAGTLIITLPPLLLHSAVRLTQVWIKHRPIRSARVTIGKESIEVTGATREDQQRLIDSFIERHTAE